MPALAPPVTDEKDGMLTYLKQMRDALRASVFGLDDEQVRATPTASACSLAGLIKHVTFVEERWVQNGIAQREIPVRDYEQSFVLAPDESLDELLALNDRTAAITREIVEALPDLDYPVPVPQGVPWFPSDVEFWNARWVLLHLVQELGRHAGHADIIRETIDGSNAFVLITKAEGENPEWLQMLEDATSR